jgi:NTE family protein
MVCGGGGAKAAAHAGVLRALEEANLAPERLFGTSMGGVFATLFASGLSAREALERVGRIHQREILQPDRLALFKGLWAGSLLKPEPFRRALARLIGPRRFVDLTLPLTITATALDTGELVLFGEGGRDVPLLDALYATCALPLFLPPAVIDGRRYADGGLRSVLPLEPAAAVGPRLVVAVDVGPGFDEFGADRPPSGLPPFVDIHNDALGILMAEQTQAALALWHRTPERPSLIYLRPVAEKGATFRVDQICRYADAGYAAARTALADLKSGAGTAD